MQTPLDPGRWARIEELFHAAIQQPPDQRREFIGRSCNGDPELLAEVESLLASYKPEDALLDQPALAQVGLMDTRPPWTAGTMIGPYRIVQILGEGGMGEVFRARDSRLNRDVALKTLPPNFAGDPAYLHRLRREAQVLGSLNHPNVATLHGIEETDGTYALVMELVEGETLHDRLTKGRMSTEEALRRAMQVAEALEAAHRKGIVHRDLKPANVMITRSGHLKVLDFGLAKRTGTLSTGSTGTVQGMILGTAGYMSPEQAQGSDVDARSDIFSFGALLYEMVTGARAFPGSTVSSALTAVLRDDPRMPPDVPREVAQIIRLCLRKDPEQRYQNITDVKLALEQVGQPESNMAARRNMTPIWIAALVTVIVAVALVMLYVRRGMRDPIIVTPLTIFPGRAMHPAISPDGKMVAFSWDGDRQDNFDIYVKLIGSGEPLRITRDPIGETNPIWSPDGRWLAFSRFVDANGATRRVFTIPALGGVEKAICPGSVGDWSPDGKSLLVLSGGDDAEPRGFFIASAENGSLRRLTTTPAGATPVAAKFAPDGKSVYYVEASSPGESKMFVVPFGGGTPNTVPIRGIRGIVGFDWIGGGHDLALLAAPEGSMIPAVYRVRDSGGQPTLLPFGRNSWSIATARNGNIAAFSQNQASTNIWRVGAWPGADRQPQQWTGSEMPSLSPAFSANGKRIAFSSNRLGIWQIWAAEADGRNETPITRFPSGGTNIVGTPTWSPDGTQITFDAYIGTFPNIWVVSAAGGEPRALTMENYGNFVPAWSPDGRWIYFTSSRTGIQTIWRISPVGGAMQQVTTQGGYAVKFSPDGRFIYYLKSRRDGELWRAPAEGGSEELLLADFHSRNFEVVVDGVYLLDSGVGEGFPDRKGRAKFYRFSTRRVEDLGFETEKPVPPYGITLSKDGKWLFYSQDDRAGSNIMLVENFR